MRELIIAGRGGEGVVLASQILADAFARTGLYAHSFPEFTAERRGAPIAAYVRWGSEPIHRRHKMRDCDVLVSVSPAPPSPEMLARVRAGGLVLLNRETRFSDAGGVAVVRVPASRIARRRGIFSAEGRPMANGAILGACVAVLLPDALPFLEDAVTARMGTLAPANVLAARDGYERCIRQHRLSTDIPPGAPHRPRRGPTPLFPVSTTDSRGNHTGAWSIERPSFTRACTACAVCILFCPEAALSRRDGRMLVDDRYCKGCGICATVCPVSGAIEMQAVAA